MNKSKQWTAQTMGRKGGNSTKARHPEQFKAMVEKRNMVNPLKREHFVEMAKLSAVARRLKSEARKLAEEQPYSPETSEIPANLPFTMEGK